ncbi:MAG: tetratricopeptide repeat protein [Pseudomonadota bacterium]
MRGWVFAAVLAIASPAGAVYPEDPGDAELAALRDRIEAGAYDSAIAALDARLATEPQNADILTLLGYAWRKSGDFTRGRTYYDRALAINPVHLGALEYLGEMEVQLGRMAEAQALLARLERACPTGCEELDELRAAIAATR